MEKSGNKPEKSEKLFDKIKAHLIEHKEAYIVGAICGTTCLITRTKVVHVIAPAFNNAPTFNNINTVAQNIGRPPHLVYIKELDKFFGSQGEAAKAIGVSDGTLSQYFTKGYETINDYHLLRYKEIV